VIIASAYFADITHFAKLFAMFKAGRRRSSPGNQYIYFSLTDRPIRHYIIVCHKFRFPLLILFVSAFGSLKNKAETLLRKIQLRVSEGLDHQTIIKIYNVSKIRSASLVLVCNVAHVRMLQILTKWNILPSHGDESVAALKQALKQLSRTIDACEKQTDLTTIHSCLEEAVKVLYIIIYPRIH
jgi:hypothetical protein